MKKTCSLYDPDQYRTLDFDVFSAIYKIKKEDVDVSLSNGVLTLKGERKSEEEIKDEK
jgi:HSP20 family molecular chaperone IbpA